MIAGIQHDMQAADDYRLLHSAGIHCARDVVRWHLIEHGGCFDFSSFLPMLRAAVETQTQIIWNLCHYGWPDGIDLLSAQFVDHFARFAKAVARLVHEHTPDIPFYAPMNEISFFAWAACRRIIFPFAEGRDSEVKQQLIRGAIAACEAVLDVDPRARFVYPEPVVHIHPVPGHPETVTAAADYNDAQFEAWDMMAGEINPKLGGNPKYLDILGVNYYHSNQWEQGRSRLRWEDEPRDPRWVPFHQLLAKVWKRYHRPLAVTETSHFGVGRARWITEIAREVYEARLLQVPVEGICLYPIIDRYDWEDRRHWHNSGLWDLELRNGVYQRVANAPYFEAFRDAQHLLASIGCV